LGASPSGRRAEPRGGAAEITTAAASHAEEGLSSSTRRERSSRGAGTRGKEAGFACVGGGGVVAASAIITHHRQSPRVSAPGPSTPTNTALFWRPKKPRTRARTQPALYIKALRRLLSWLSRGGREKERRSLGCSYTLKALFAIFYNVSDGAPMRRQ
jgi:hypothetical protein